MGRFRGISSNIRRCRYRRDRGILARSSLKVRFYLGISSWTHLESFLFLTGFCNWISEITVVRRASNGEPRCWWFRGGLYAGILPAISKFRLPIPNRSLPRWPSNGWLSWRRAVVGKMFTDIAAESHIIHLHVRRRSCQKSDNFLQDIYRYEVLLVSFYDEKGSQECFFETTNSFSTGGACGSTVRLLLSLLSSLKIWSTVVLSGNLSSLQNSRVAAFVMA